MFNPGLSIGENINNSKLCSIFKCSPQGGMRKSNTTGTLVIVADYIKGIYHDKWIGGVLHYTGMGLSGDQDINYMQNRTLNESDYNGIDVFLFEVMDEGVYTYCGRVQLVDTPYADTQPDENGKKRRVWMFPVRPVPDNNVVKPSMYVFRDMADYRARGANVDKTYALYRASLKKKPKSQQPASSQGGNTPPSKPFSINGKTINHKVYGQGIVTKYDGVIITVKFKAGIKTLNYQLCMDNNIITVL